MADMTPSPLPAGSRRWQDLGCLAFTLPQVEILMPTKKPRGQELPLAPHLANQALHQRRLRIEHVNRSVKRGRMVTDRIRLWKEGVRRCGDGDLLCPASLPGAPEPLAANGLIGINSNTLSSFLQEVRSICTTCNQF